MSKKVWSDAVAGGSGADHEGRQGSAAEQRELWAAKEQESLEAMKAAGVVITEVSPEEKQRFQDAMKPVYEKHAADLAPMIERIQAVQ